MILLLLIIAGEKTFDISVDIILLYDNIQSYVWTIITIKLNNVRLQYEIFSLSICIIWVSFIDYYFLSIYSCLMEKILKSKVKIIFKTFQRLGMDMCGYKCTCIMFEKVYLLLFILINKIYFKQRERVIV